MSNETFVLTNADMTFGNIKDEEAVYFLKNEQGTFVFKVILPLDVE